MFMKETLLFASGGRSHYRIPSVVADAHGVLYAFCNDRKDTVADFASEISLVARRKKAGGDWEPERTLAAVPGWACNMGSAVYDGAADTVFCSGRRIPVQRNEFGSYTPEERAEIDTRARAKARDLGIRMGQFLLLSNDGGDTWRDRPLEVIPRSHVHWDGVRADLGGDCHGSAHGVQLRHGPHAGRLLCPSRTQIGEYSDWDGLRKCVYNNAIYSDDHGATWQASSPVQLATGEGALIENRDGSITYNSRAYFQDQKRYLATSLDGGSSYGNFRTDDFLMEEKNIGCNASFLRVEREDLADSSLLPGGADGVTLFANPRSQVRENMTICLSFDSGRVWREGRRVYAGPCAYSSLDFSPATQRFCLLYERGESDPCDSGIAALEFDLEWLLKSR